MRERTKIIREFILDNVKEHPKDIAKVTAKEFDISRQAVNKHLKALVDSKEIVANGDRNSRVYELASNELALKKYQLPGVDESEIYINDFSESLVGYSKNVQDLTQYIFTEMVNNANDHSEGDELRVVLIRSHDMVSFFIKDNGVGIFKKIANALDLSDEKQALLELDKGKFTTDPENHTGEGIFFSVKASDEFCISSGESVFTHNTEDEIEDYLYDQDNSEGTTITFSILSDNKTTLKEIFDKYSDDEYGFSKTVVNVELLRMGNENLISRSQAKRLIARFENFKQIELNFENVDMIGQAFADEVFRVFQRRYPNIVLEPVNTTEDVDRMIKRARNRLKEMEQE